MNEVALCEARLEEAKRAEPEWTGVERERLLELGQDLKDLWDHPDAPIELKKRIVRTVIDEIVVSVDSERSQLVCQIRWAGGVHAELRVNKNRTGLHGHRLEQNVVDAMRDLAEVCPDKFIARILNMSGQKTATGLTWTAARVAGFRGHHQIPVPNPNRPRIWLTPTEAATRLGSTPAIIRQLLRDGVLPGRQVVKGAPWMIDPKDLELSEAQAASRRKGEKPASPGQQQLFADETD